ncbi:MAG TPA: hypothetical protein VMG39_02100 [Pseudolabrys sp.]|nr:hypothetical protein [Pseudolabrys sp.]
MNGNATNHGEPIAYTYRPSLLGAPWQFGIVGDGIDWSSGRKSGHVPFRAIYRVRLSYRPTSMQSHRFMAELWAEGAPKLQILSNSWKSMVEVERLDKAYTDFIGALHRRIVPVAPSARFERGSQALLYWPGLVVFVGVSLVLAWLIARALQADAKAGAAFVGGFLALFLWQAGNYFRRNRPGLYRPDAMPADVMPKR